MLYQIKSFITDLDIIPNHIDSYPIKLKSTKSEDDFWEYLYQNNFNFICYHLTRLTKKEATKIKKFGIKPGLKDNLINKVYNLPRRCNFFKKEIIEHVKNLRQSEINDNIYAFFGRLDLKNSRTAKQFCQNWGGEAIYNFYNHNDTCQSGFLKKVHNTLKKVSRPYLIVLKVNDSCFETNCDAEKIFEAYKKGVVAEINGTLITNSAKVVKIIDLSKNKVKF